MKKKRILTLALSLSLLCGLSSAFAAGPAGSSSDPLISKSYIDNIYPGIVLKDPFDLLKNSMAVLEYKLNQQTAGLSVYTVSAGGSISAGSGGSFVLLSGGAKVSQLAGTLIDVTAGVTLSVGDALTARHRYVAGGSTNAKMTASSSTKISAMGSVTVGSLPMSFTDVSTDAWFYNNVLYAYTNGLINGKTDTIFAPDDNLKISEAIKLAACMHQLYNTGSVTLVNGATTWYSTFLEYALNNGILTKTYQNYEAYITRNEFVNLFYAALPSSEFNAINTIADGAIPDVKMTDLYAARIYSFYRAGILNGKDAKGSFLPNDNIKRSEVAAIMSRMFEKDQRVSASLQ